MRAAAASREHLRRWMAWASHSDLATHRRFLADSDEGWRRGTRFEYAIRDRDAQLLGGVGLMQRIGPGGLELGYWVHAEHTHRGVASRAAAALTEAALALRAITHVEVHHDEANVASGAVPARLGFSRLGVWPAPAQAPADSGREVRWRMDARDFPASEASALLERSRAVGEHDGEPAVRFVVAPADSAVARHDVEAAADIWASATAAREGDEEVAPLQESLPPIVAALAGSPRSLLILGVEQGGAPDAEQGAIRGVEQGVIPGAEQGVIPGAEQGGRAVAFAVVEADVCADPAHALVRYLGVHPERWGTGIGGGLVRALPAHLRAAGFHSAHLTVYEDNTRAIRTYERAGWQLAAERIVHPRTAKIMRRYDRDFRP